MRPKHCPRGRNRTTSLSSTNGFSVVDTEKALKKEEGGIVFLLRGPGHRKREQETPKKKETCRQPAGLCRIGNETRGDVGHTCQKPVVRHPIASLRYGRS